MYNFQQIGYNTIRPTWYYTINPRSLAPLA
jgi:hypothetical protein